MTHGDFPATPLLEPQASTFTPAMTPRARTFRLLVGIVGVLIALAFVPSLQAADPTQLLVIGALMIVAELWLSITVGRRIILLSAAFTLLAALSFGAAPALVLNTATWVMSRVLWRLVVDDGRDTLFLVFNAGQIALSGLAGGAAVWLATDTPLVTPPIDLVPALLSYTLAYLGTNISLTTLATWLRGGMGEVRTQLWPVVSLWTALGFVPSMLVAYVVVQLQTSVGLVTAALIAFAIMAIISYVVRLNVRYQATNRELRVLNAVSQQLASSRDLNSMYPTIYQHVQRLMPADVFLIALVEAEQDQIAVPYIVEHDETLAPRTFPFESTLTGQILRSNQPLMLLHHTAAPDQFRFGASERHSTSLLFVPLRVGDQAIGVLSAQSYQAEAYTAHHLELLQAIAQIAAVAINNVRLFAREKAVLRSRDEFVSLVAHELKNPLAALLGHAQLLDRRLRNAEDKVRRPVGIIHEQGERISRLVEDLLDLSRADTGRLTLNCQRLDLGTLVRDITEQQRTLTTRHRFELAVAPELPVITADVFRLTQVLQNLLGNAIKYSPDGGTIRVAVDRCTLDQAQPPRRVVQQLDNITTWLRVQISDSGIGIPADQIDRIFDRFYRARNTAQLDVSGSGLGLSICDGLIRAQGGGIWAASQPDHGSTFVFVLPVKPAEPLNNQ